MTKEIQDRINNYLANGGRVLQVPKESKFVVVGTATMLTFEITEEDFDELLETEVIELERYRTDVMKFRKVESQ
jgi:hypothetical protein